MRDKQVHILDEMLKAATDATNPTTGQSVILRDGIEAVRESSQDGVAQGRGGRLPLFFGFDLRGEGFSLVGCLADRFCP